VRKTVKLAVLAIFVIGFLLRFVGTNPGYNRFHSDEGITYSAAVSMIKNGNLDPLRYDYPALTPLVNYVFFKFLFVPLGWLGYYLTHITDVLDGLLKISLPDEEKRRIFQLYILGEREVKALIWGRYVTALISSGSLILTYLLAQKLFGKLVGIFALLFLALNFRATLNAHIGLPDTYNAFFVLLSLLASFNLWQKRRLVDYLISGLCIGLSVSVKYQFFIFTPFLLAHFFGSSSTPMLKKLFDHKLFTAFLTSLIVFLIINPYFFINFESTLEWTKSVSLKYSMGRNDFNFFPLTYFFHVDFGPILSIFVLLGMISACLKKPKEVVFVFVYLGIFLFVTLYYSVAGFYVRNFVSITPILMIFAGIFVKTLYDFCIRYLSVQKSAVIVTLILLVAVFHTGRNAMINSVYYIQDWNYETIVKKARLFLKNGDKIASHPFDPLPEDLRLVRGNFGTETSYSIAEFLKDGDTFALINMDWAGNQFYGWMVRSFHRSFWNKPVEKMRETYWGLTIEEMLKYTVAYASKPWQAPDANLYLIKIPDFKKFLFESEVNFGLDKADDWKLIHQSDLNNPSVAKVSVCNYKNCLCFSGLSGDFDIGYFESPSVSINGGYIYRLSGKVNGVVAGAKSDKNVFLRMNMLDSNNHTIFTSVSDRFDGLSSQTLTAYAWADESVSSLKVGFQASGPTASTYCLSDLSLEKSQKPDGSFSDNFLKIPAEDYIDLLYPFSHGNL